MEITCQFCGERLDVDSVDALRYVARERAGAEPATSLIVESAAGGDRLLHRCIPGVDESAATASGGAA